MTWLRDAFDAAMMFVGLRAFDRLVVIPLLSRGGKVPVQRFVHQIISVVVTLFAILCYGASVFGWDIDKFLAGSAVVSIVLGLALQETLGNFFSGLVMQAASPFAIGDWISCAGVEGRVVDMNWRAVTIQTLEDNWVIVPNGAVAKDQIVNFAAPTMATARSVQVGLGYELPPADATDVLTAAVLETHGVAENPAPFVYLDQFSDSAMTYRVKFWITEPEKHYKIESQVRTHIWYRLKQKGFSIPFPMRTVEHVTLDAKQKQQSATSAAQRLAAVNGLWLLAPLSDDERKSLAEEAGDVLLSTGQTLFKQDDAGDTFYIIRKGEADVFIRHNDKAEAKVATLKTGDFFGEMSALTGQPRSATVRAATALQCVEICKEDLQHLFDAHPDTMGKLCHVIAERTAEMQAVVKTAQEAEAAKAEREQKVVEKEKSLTSMVRAFFGRGGVPANQGARAN
jgi:small-conductance mechanosensitive channel